MAPAVDDTTSDSALPFGMLLLLAGLVLLFWPAATIRVLASLVGFGAVAYGVSELARAFRGSEGHPEFSAGMIGLVSVFGGVIIAITPSVSDIATAPVIGAYLLIGGIVEVVVGSLFRPSVRPERLLMGIVSSAVGTLILVLPAASLVLLVWLAGAWLLAAGAIVALMRSLARPRRAVA